MSDDMNPITPAPGTDAPVEPMPMPEAEPMAPAPEAPAEGEAPAV